MFDNCTSLISVTIPAGVTSIDENVFGDCTSLTSVTVKATTPPSLSAPSIFGNYTKLNAIYVPAESVEAYKNAYGWKDHADKIQAIA